jgi:hypothetical protein
MKKVSITQEEINQGEGNFHDYMSYVKIACPPSLLNQVIHFLLQQTLFLQMDTK